MSLNMWAEAFIQAAINQTSLSCYNNLLKGIAILLEIPSLSNLTEVYSE